MGFFIVRKPAGPQFGPAELTAATTKLVEFLFGDAGPAAVTLDPFFWCLVDELMRDVGARQALPSGYFTRLLAMVVAREIEDPARRMAFQDSALDGMSELGLSEYESERLAARVALDVLYINRRKLEGQVR